MYAELAPDYFQSFRFSEVSLLCLSHKEIGSHFHSKLLYEIPPDYFGPFVT